MNLEEKSMKELLELHNSIADAPAGPKTFSTRPKLLARIRSITESKGLALDAVAIPGAHEEPQSTAHADAKPRAAEAADTPKEPKKRGLGVGELARVLLMDPAGYPHALIAAMVNEQIEGAAATHKSVRWYAAKMRKEGIEVPPRAKVFPAYMDEKQTSEYLKTVTVVKEASE